MSNSLVPDLDNFKRRLLTLGEAEAVGVECLIETIGILALQMGLCKKIAKDKERWHPETRMLARTLVPQIENEIHELKIRIENEKLGEVPF